MKSILIVLTTILLSVSLSLTGQKNVDLKLKSSHSDATKNCYDILLSSPDGHDIHLAGQNYRLFYDADNLKFLTEEITHNLDPKAYADVDLLVSEEDIGFVSMSIDSRQLVDAGITLPKTGAWINTMNICFKRLNDRDYDITWANQRKTFSFATAEVAMSEWLNEGKQQILIPNEIHDFSSIEQNLIETAQQTISVYPNPVVQHVNVTFEAPYSGEVLVKDIIGRHVVADQISDETFLEYDLSAWPEGGYTVMILNQDGALVRSQALVKINN